MIRFPIALAMTAALGSASVNGPRAAQPQAARTAELEEYIALFQSLAQDALASPRLADPFPCLPHWLAGSDHVVVAVSAAGTAAGLAPGDTLRRIEDIALTGRADGLWDAAIRSMKTRGATYQVTVSREGSSVLLDVPCSPDLARASRDAERAMWTAVANGEWTGCIAAGRTMMRVFGAPLSPALMIMTRCSSATSGSPDPGMSGELGHALLREMVAHPRPSPDLREQLFLTLRDLDAAAAAGAQDHAAG